MAKAIHAADPGLFAYNIPYAVELDGRLRRRDGRVDMTKLRPLARLGYMDYAPLGEVFEMMRPNWPVGS